MIKIKTRSKFDPVKEHRPRETRVWGMRVDLFAKEIGLTKPALLSGGKRKKTRSVGRKLSNCSGVS